MRVGIVGAGLAGLMAARSLEASRHEVVLFDKGRSPGGRLATRRIGGATIDHGAQFFTVRTDTFARFVDAWRGQGLVAEWCRGFGAQPDGYPRYMVPGGMNALAKRLAVGLEVRTATLVFGLRSGTRATSRPWRIINDDGRADPVLLGHDRLGCGAST